MALRGGKNSSGLGEIAFRSRAQLASAAAWSPGPKNLPLYLDLPLKDGVVPQEVIAKSAANAPLAFVDQHINLRRYRGISIDVGDQGGLRAGAAKLHEILDRYGVANTLEVYPGYAYQRSGGLFPEARSAIFQQEFVFGQEL